MKTLDYKEQHEEFCRRFRATNSVTQQFDALTGQATQIPFMKSPSLNINHYVVSKAMEGLFFEVGQEEKKIRTDPAARTTTLLKQVFGSGH